MKTFDVPKVSELPVSEPRQWDYPALASFFLTSLLKHDSTLLHAEWRSAQPTIDWFLRQRESHTEHDDVVLATLPADTFRPVLGRLGVVLMGDQAYGGHARLILAQDGRRHECLIYMSNCSESGLWIRIYAHTA